MKKVIYVVMGVVPMNDVSTILPEYQPLLGLHLMNGAGKQKACLKHVYYYGKIFKQIKLQLPSNSIVT